MQEISFSFFWVAVFVFASSCTPTADEVKAEFDAALSATKDCDLDASCVVLKTGCPLGCFVAVHEDDQDEIDQLSSELTTMYITSSDIDDVIEACGDIQCDLVVESICVEGRCEVETVLEAQ